MYFSVFSSNLQHIKISDMKYLSLLIALLLIPLSVARADGDNGNGNGNGNAGGASGNRTATGNKVVMPKTGGGDEIRYILSAFLFLFGTVQLVTSVTKKVKTA